MTAKKKRAPPLTLAMLKAMSSCMGECEAGGWEGQTQSLPDDEAIAFEKTADLARDWLAIQIVRRQGIARQLGEVSDD